MHCFIIIELTENFPSTCLQYSALKNINVRCFVKLVKIRLRRQSKTSLLRNPPTISAFNQNYMFVRMKQN